MAHLAAVVAGDLGEGGCATRDIICTGTCAVVWTWMVQEAKAVGEVVVEDDGTRDST